MRDENPDRPPEITAAMDTVAQDSGGYAQAALNMLHAPDVIDRVTEHVGNLPHGAGEGARFAAIDSMVERGEELALTDGWLTAWMAKPDTLCFDAHDDTLAGHDDDGDEHEIFAGISILGDVHTNGTRQSIALRLTVSEALDFASDLIIAANSSALHATRHGWPLAVDDSEGSG